MPHLSTALSSDIFWPVKLLSWKWLLSLISIWSHAYVHHLISIFNYSCVSPAKIHPYFLLLIHDLSLEYSLLMWFISSSNFNFILIFHNWWILCFITWIECLFAKFYCTWVLQKTIKCWRYSSHSHEESNIWR